jgi:hypothetical protein
MTRHRVVDMEGRSPFRQNQHRLSSTSILVSRDESEKDLYNRRKSEF